MTYKYVMGEVMLQLGRWNSLARESSPFKRRKTLILNLLHLYLIMGKASGINPKDKNWNQSPKVGLVLNPTSFWQHLWQHQYQAVSALDGDIESGYIARATVGPS